MKIIIKLILFFQIAVPSVGLGQQYSPFIEEIMNQTNLVSLVSFVRILSGEDSVKIGDSTVLITNRISYLGNEKAADYIYNKLNQYGFETYNQVYSPTGRNIYAIQRGAAFPNKYFIYCAHYDAVDSYCADDNASGVAGVLEAARILRNYQLNYSVIYAFWDEEENGKVGSRFFAARSDSNNLDILGVLNFEMSGWDSNNDGLIDIHTKNIANSVPLANLLTTADSLYNLPLNPVVYNPGTWASDHAAFWEYGYSAIVFSEAYWGGDFNPYYHSSQDRIDKFNLDYFKNVSKLGLAAISTLGMENIISSVEDDIEIPKDIFINSFPNPFNNSAIIQYSIPEESYLTISLYNSIGEKIMNLFEGLQKAGKHEINLNGSGLSSGVYFLILTTNKSFYSNKVILLK